MKKTFQEIYTAEFFKIKYNVELFEFAVINFAGVLIPLFLGHPQLLVGTIVNALLFYSAIEFKNKKILPVIFLPSMAVAARGLIFGPLTYFLIILIPFIWVANSIQVFATRFFMLRKMNLALSFFISAVLKATFLFAITFIFVSVTDMPRIFLLAMGPVQLVTAALGGVLVFGLAKSNLLTEQRVK